MTTFESKTESISASSKDIFIKLSNLENLQEITEKINDDRVKNIKLTPDTCYFHVDPIGEVGIKAIEKTEFKSIKFESDKSPVVFNIWIELEEISSSETNVKVVLKADLPMMLKMMVSDPINKFINILVSSLTKISY